MFEIFPLSLKSSVRFCFARLSEMPVFTVKNKRWKERAREKSLSEFAVFRAASYHARSLVCSASNIVGGGRGRGRGEGNFYNGNFSHRGNRAEGRMSGKQ